MSTILQTETTSDPAFIEPQRSLSGPYQWLPGLTFSPPGADNRGDILVCIFQRGAVDGLSMVVPISEDNYYQSRPTIAIPQPAASNVNTAVTLDAKFGLHPSLRALKPVWDDGALAAVHACGSPDPTHSHFDAQAYMEHGTPGEKQISTGWISRHLQSTSWQNPSPVRAVSLGTMLPFSLRGETPAVAIRSIAEFRLGGKTSGNSAIAKLEKALRQAYAGSADLGGRAQTTFAAMDALQKIKPGDYSPANGAKYSDDDFGQGLKQIAQLIKAGIGLEIATLDIGGWDTHILQGAAEGQLAHLLLTFGSNLAAFYQDLNDQFHQITLITMSEFGRRVKENGNGGTDHGHGNVMFVMSKNISAAKIYGNWPGLANENLYGPGDLAVTTDYRQVLAELLQQRLKNPRLDQVLPGFKNGPGLNLFKT